MEVFYRFSRNYDKARSLTTIWTVVSARAVIALGLLNQHGRVRECSARARRRVDTALGTVAARRALLEGGHVRTASAVVA